MKTEKITLKNETGLHARPASEIVKIASKYQSTISLIANGKTINAKSILNIMAAGIKSSTEIEIQCDGADEESAMKELLQAFHQLYLVQHHHLSLLLYGENHS